MVTRIKNHAKSSDTAHPMKVMQNPTMTISVTDMPLRVIAGLSTLAKSPEDDYSIENGMVVSEVGPPVTVKHPAWCDDFVAYMLRAPRRLKNPDFIFGGMHMGAAFSAFLPRRISAPAIGTPVIINPVITTQQKTLMSLYNFGHANVYWIVHVPAPLGTGIYLKIYAPEFDNTTETRGIRFKPSGQPTVAFMCPWSNDFSSVPIATGRKGQSGGAIAIETIEDNSNETVNTPLQITVWCCVTDVTLTGYAIANSSASEMAGLNFMSISPVSEEDVVRGEEEADNEVSAEGGKTVDEFIYDKEAIPVAPEVEKQAEKPKDPSPKVATRKNDTGNLATKWYDYAQITLGTPSNYNWTVVTIDPYNDITLAKNGEAIVLPWKRNVWTSGSQSIGYIRTMVAQFNVPRPPQISGVLEVKDSINNSSISLIEFGGKVEVPLMPKVFNGLAASAKHPRNYLNPWMRCSESKVEFAYRVIAFNRTSDIADLKVSILLRPGDSVFQVPTKPKKSITARDYELVDLLMYEYNVHEEAMRVKPEKDVSVIIGSEESLPEESAPMSPNPAQFITPMTAMSPEEYTLHEELGEDELLDLDEFPVLVFKGEVNTDEVTSIQLDLATIFDQAWDGEQNAISQKFQRFAHIIPKNAGGFGPVIGNYTITVNLPTGMAGRILHNCLPGDMVDIAASRIFGLGSLLGVAGTAVSAIGGPLMNGLVNTAAPILSGAAHAIGGNVVGGLADAALNVASNVLTPKEKTQPSANANAISGDIPISRFVEMLKYVKGNYLDNPVFPTLLIEPQNFLNNAGTLMRTIPIEVFANMRNVKVERNVFDRQVVPDVSETLADIILPYHALPEIMRDFLQAKSAFRHGSKQNIYFRKFLRAVSNRHSIRQHLTLNEIINCPIEDDNVSVEIGRAKRYLRNLGGGTNNEIFRTVGSKLDDSSRQLEF